MLRSVLIELLIYRKDYAMRIYSYYATILLMFMLKGCIVVLDSQFITRKKI